jgi:hypothetical protein
LKDKIWEFLQVQDLLHVLLIQVNGHKHINRKLGNISAISM